MKLADVIAQAAAGIELLGEGHVTVRWDGALAVKCVAVVDGRCGRAEGDGDVERLVKVARLRAAQPRAWPAPELPEAHQGVVELGGGVLEAHANSRGLRTASAFAPWPAPPPRGSSPGPGPRSAEDVAGPAVVAEALAGLRDALGVRLALRGPPPPRLPRCISLVDDSSVGLARAFDAEGVPRQRVTLYEEGLFRDAVRDSSSPPTTGHATRALTLAPRADNLVMAAGDADLGTRGAVGSMDLADVVEVGRERRLVALRGGGCALVPAVRVLRP